MRPTSSQPNRKDHEWRGVVLTARPAKPKPDPFAASALAAASRSAVADDGDKDASSLAKRPRLQPPTVEVARRQLREAVTPLCHLPYAQQLARKAADMQRQMAQLRRDIADTGRPEVAEIRVLPAVASPVTTKYRNKCQFTVAWSLTDPERVIVGYRVGKYRDGEAGVHPPDWVDVAPDATLAVVRRLEAALNEPDLLARAPPYDPQRHGGCFKEATVRCNAAGETLLYVDMHAPFVAAASGGELRDFLESRLRDRLLLDAPGGVASLHALYSDRTGGAGEWRHLGGAADITERLGDFRFRVSPAAFFQVNTAAAALLYERIGCLLKLRPPWTAPEEAETAAAPAAAEPRPSALLDVCCGTGTIGICLSRQFPHVVGIELVPQAVLDAESNAGLNGVANAKFVCARAEDAVTREAALLADELGGSGGDLAVVLDPPRSGVQPAVLAALRRCPLVRRLVFVSCNPRAARANFLDLCRPQSNKWRGQPFCPVLVQPVDLFPMTEHCELLVLFARD